LVLAVQEGLEIQRQMLLELLDQILYLVLLPHWVEVVEVAMTLET
jgi:hypothetical protein